MPLARGGAGVAVLLWFLLIADERGCQRRRRHESGLDKEGTQHAALFPFVEVGEDEGIGLTGGKAGSVGRKSRLNETVRVKMAKISCTEVPDQTGIFRKANSTPESKKFERSQAK